MKDNGTRKRIVRIIMRIGTNYSLGILPRQAGILLRIDGILRAEYSRNAHAVVSGIFMPLSRNFQVGVF